MPRFVWRLACLAGATAIALAAAATGSAASAGQCQNDAKLLANNPIFLNSATTTPTADAGPGTWWGITKAGFDAAGITDYEAFIESAFGETYPDLDAAVSAVIDNAALDDRNGNDFVCATSLRGTRAHLLKKAGFPDYSQYFFGVLDDKRVS